MTTPAFADRLRAGETLFSAWSVIPEPLVAEIVARSGFDCVSFDIQHGLHDIDSTMRSIAVVVAAGRSAAVRIALGDYATAARMLDMGAEAVIAPMISSAADARALVAATKYPPVGERSWGPDRARALRGTTPQQHLESANRASLVFAMVETRRAVGALDDILTVEGLDGVFVGPSDLSITFFDGTRVSPFDSALDETIAMVADRVNAAQKLSGIFGVTAESAVRFREMGYRFIAVGTDQIYLEHGAKAMLAAARGSRAE